MTCHRHRNVGDKIFNSTLSMGAYFAAETETSMRRTFSHAGPQIRMRRTFYKKRRPRPKWIKA